LFIIIVAGLLTGCGVSESVEDLVNQPIGTDPSKEYENLSDYYEKFFKMVSSRGMTKKGTTRVTALDALPKDPNGEVQWTTAVVEGLIDPKASLDPDYIEEPPLNLNIFIEAKSPLFANVLFPHSIHTYWLNCSTCHPNIFLPEAGANPITMDEIFQGKWCGRCHGKVAFTFWPRANCTRCHIIPKGASRQQEHWR
jgi:c(7)-type cytochrome triheme protein